MRPKITVSALLEEGVGRLRGGAEAASADLEAQLLLAHVLKVPRTRLKSHPESRVPSPACRRYRALVARRARGVPIAYLTGRKEFWSLALGVTPAVLIPRPETELLVERALALRTPAAARIADLGTGSGAVALALASERPAWQVLATDRSARALEVARANARALKLTGVRFRRGDWFRALKGARFDLLVSNPPYVDRRDPLLKAGELAHEPRRALSPAGDAFSSLDLLVRGAPRHLGRGGWLLLEHGAEQGAQVRQALVLAGFRHVRSHRDLGGHERVTEGQHGHL